jgi:hypothetical protein
VLVRFTDKDSNIICLLFMSLSSFSRSFNLFKKKNHIIFHYLFNQLELGVVLFSIQLYLIYFYHVLNQSIKLYSIISVVAGVSDLRGRLNFFTGARKETEYRPSFASPPSSFLPTRWPPC